MLLLRGRAAVLRHRARIGAGCAGQPGRRCAGGSFSVTWISVQHVVWAKRTHWTQDTGG